MKRVAMAVVGSAAAILVGLIAFGAFDPLPTGDPTWVEPPHLVRVVEQPQVLWLEPAFPASGHVRIEVELVEGDPDVGAGLLLGGPDAWLGVAVSPLGYVRVWQETPAGAIEHMPWQPWPHVRRAAAANEIDARIEREAVVLYLNRERLWSGEAPAPVASVAVWGRAYGEPATVYYGPLRFFGGAEP